MKTKVCKDCKFYKRPSILARMFSRSAFLERCLHEKAVTEIDGSPMPCITMRVHECRFGSLYEPKSVE